jgi:UDP-N-acetylmuramoyl-tripeptide--D-alanyl-D-alanine ligase
VIDAISEIPKILKKFRKRVRTKARELYAKSKRYWTAATVVVVTGSSGKTTTVALLKHILSGEAQVLSQALSNGYTQAVRALSALEPSDRYAVIEQGTEAPGQLARAANLLRPDVAIVTLVAMEHYASFRSIDAVAKEKAAFVEKLPNDGLAILNFDDPRTRAMSGLTRARSVSFGTTGGEYKVTNISECSDAYLSFTLTSADLSLPVRTKLLGKYNWLSVAAAATCALELGVSPQNIAARIASFAPIRGRMSMHRLDGGIRMILDTAKAPFHSIYLPLETLSTIRASRKRFVMGQISDYSGNATRKYKDTYAAAAQVADEVCFVGPWSHKARAPAEDVESGKFRAFSTVQALSSYLRETAVDGEVVVVKSSRNLHLERLLLDRTEGVRCWANECGSKLSCSTCGLYGTAFYEHNGRNEHRGRVAQPRSEVID